MKIEEILDRSKEFLAFGHSIERTYVKYVRPLKSDIDFEYELLDYARELEFLSRKIEEFIRYSNLCRISKERHDTLSLREFFIKKKKTLHVIEDVTEELKENKKNITNILFDNWNLMLNYKSFGIN